MEIWKEIGNNFEVSSYGRIRKWVNRRGNKVNDAIYRKLVLRKKDGYVDVQINGKNLLVHRIVAMYFIPNPNNYPEVDHIDCNRSNNCIENLRWVTRSMNVKYSYDVGNNYNTFVPEPHRKLSDIDILTLHMFFPYHTKTQWAKLFDVSYQCIQYNKPKYEPRK